MADALVGQVLVNQVGPFATFYGVAGVQKRLDGMDDFVHPTTGGSPGDIGWERTRVAVAWAFQ